jgi:hypothetical protein
MRQYNGQKQTIQWPKTDNTMAKEKQTIQWPKTDNTMANKKQKTKEQTTIYKNIT